MDIQQMTLEEKIGQLFMLAFSGDRLDEARVLMQEHLVGAAYISNDNVPSPQAAVQLTNELQSYANRTRLKFPLLLGADQEGAWSVMTPGSSPGPGNMAIGATNDPKFAYDMYGVIARELAAVGLNTVLGPCADCNSNPRNSIIGMRSFGEKPELVGKMTGAAVRGAQENGVLAAVKHFPGHGDTTQDSHRGLPAVDRSLDELRRIDLFPFAEGIKAGVGMVMTAHIVFSALDADNPATLSPVILGDVLRGELGFDGVILSDSMNMGAMKRHFDPAKSVVRALNAGVDLIMLAEEHYDHDAARYLDDQRALLKAVIDAVQDGSLPEERVNDAVRRVVELKSRFAFSTSPVEETQSVLGVVGSRSSRAVELDVSQHAISVIRDENALLPLALDAPLTLVNTTERGSYTILGNTRGIGPNQTTSAFEYFAAEVSKKRGEARVVWAEELSNDIAHALDGVVVAVTENYPLPGMDFAQSSQPRIIRQLMEIAGDQLVVVALRDPYELAHFPEIKTYICAFSFRPCAAAAAVDVLFGQVEAGGRTPVSVPDVGLYA